jgi:hypothetical protein
VGGPPDRDPRDHLHQLLHVGPRQLIIFTGLPSIRRPWTSPTGRPACRTPTLPSVASRCSGFRRRHRRSSPDVRCGHGALRVALLLVGSLPSVPGRLSRGRPRRNLRTAGQPDAPVYSRQLTNVRRWVAAPRPTTGRRPNPGACHVSVGLKEQSILTHQPPPGRLSVPDRDAPGRGLPIARPRNPPVRLPLLTFVAVLSQVGSHCPDRTPRAAGHHRGHR